MRLVNIVIVALFIIAIGQIETAPIWGLFHGFISFILFIQHHVGWEELKQFIDRI